MAARVCGNGKKHTESGAVYVLLVVLASVLIAGLALVVDLGILASQKTKFDATAEQAALGALEAYVRVLTDRPEALGDALDAALRKAKSVAGTNITAYFGSKIRHDPDAPVSDLTTDESGENGTLVPGIWSFEAAPGVACDNPGEVPPCFRTAAAGERANAMRVILRPNRGSALRVIFNTVNKSSFDEYETRATASLVPRRGVFLLDLSRSVVRDTHLNSDAEYAFSLKPGVSCSAGWESDLVAGDAFLFNRLAAGPRVIDDEKVHYQSEYACFDTLSGSFAIDLGPGPGPFTRVYRPEPLSGILDGIHAALQRFQARAVAGDMAGVIGFDDEILPARRMTLTSPDTPEFATMLAATDTASPIADRVQFLLFPRYYGGEVLFTPLAPGGSPRPAMTDVALALNEAYTMLANAPDFGFSDNFVVLISDGLANCVGTPGPAGRCYFNIFDLTTSEQYTQAAFNEIAVTSGIYRNSKIALHIFLIGNDVAPHHLLRKLGDGCMSDEEARAGDGATPYDFVDPSGGTLDPRDTVPYYFPNDLYRQSRRTGGLWLPIVDPCGESPVSGLTVAEYLDFECQGMMANGDLVRGLSAPLSSFVDANGRLRCDPQRRSKNQQVADTVNDIMRANPFLLVE